MPLQHVFKEISQNVQKYLDKKVKICYNISNRKEAEIMTTATLQLALSAARTSGTQHPERTDLIMQYSNAAFHIVNEPGFCYPAKARENLEKAAQAGYQFLNEPTDDNWKLALRAFANTCLGTPEQPHSAFITHKMKMSSNLLVEMLLGFLPKPIQAEVVALRNG